MHGCKRDILHAYLQKTVSSGNIIELDQETDWAVGEEIVISASSFDHRETEYFTITAKDGKKLTLNADVQFRHLGAADSILTGNWNPKNLHMGAVVALLSRNIIIDGSDGANEIFGGRVLIASTVEKEGGDSFYRSGHGQFSYVQVNLSL